MASPDGLEPWKHPASMQAAMIIVEFDRDILVEAGVTVQESFSQRLSEDNNLSTGHCEQQDYAYVMLNEEMEAIRRISECISSDDTYSKTKIYAIMTDETMKIIAFTSSSRELQHLWAGIWQIYFYPEDQ